MSELLHNLGVKVRHSSPPENLQTVVERARVELTGRERDSKNLQHARSVGSPAGAWTHMGEFGADSGLCLWEAQFSGTRAGRTASSYSFPCAIDAWIVSDPTGRSFAFQGSAVRHDLLARYPDHLVTAMAGMCVDSTMQNGRQRGTTLRPKSDRKVGQRGVVRSL